MIRFWWNLILTFVLELFIKLRSFDASFFCLVCKYLQCCNSTKQPIFYHRWRQIPLSIVQARFHYFLDSFMSDVRALFETDKNGKFSVVICDEMASYINFSLWLLGLYFDCNTIIFVFTLCVHNICFYSFSNLFNSSNKPVKKSPTPRLRYNAPTSSPQRRPTPSSKTSPSAKNRRDRLGSANGDSAGTA